MLQLQFWHTTTQRNPWYCRPMQVVKGWVHAFSKNKNLYILPGELYLRHKKGYVVIELESLAVTWAMEKFHHFLYGNEFVLETDQKPLQAILLKRLNQATPRLQHILIRTFPYHFKVRYIPGMTNHIADCLPRIGFQKDSISLPKLHINQITSQLKARSNSLHNLQNGNTGWWQTCYSQTHHPSGMA